MPALAADTLLDVVFGDYGFTWRHLPYVDLTGLPPAMVLQLCGRLVASGRVLLHGSNSTKPFARLEPRQANDAWKASGNLHAVYASDEVFIVLMQALLDRSFLRERLSSFYLGYRLVEGVSLLKVSANIYVLFQSGEPKLFSGGYIYILDKQSFIQAPDSTVEWFSHDPVVPWCALKVPTTLSGLLFRVGHPDGADSVLAYSPVEMQRLLAAGGP